MKRLLWIDDDERLIDASVSIFRKNGFELIKATNTSRALSILRDERLDGVLLDVRLRGDESGLELLKELRRLYPFLKIAVFTAYPEYDDHVFAEEAGATIYLSKIRKSIPLDPDKQRRFFQSIDKVFSDSMPQEPSRPQFRTRSTIKILFMASNPVDTTPLRLDEEMRAIDSVLRKSEFRERFEILQHWATRVSDLQEILLRHRPHILHFSGHGNASNEIILLDNFGRGQPVSNRALGGIFGVLRDDIRCVVLNACFSELQARAIAEHVDCVVGMSSAVGDIAAISFASSFYQAIGFGRDIKTAFDLGCLQIDLESLGEEGIPKLLALRCDPKDVVPVASAVHEQRNDQP